MELSGEHAEIAAKWSAIISSYIGRVAVPVVEEVEEN